VIEVEEELGYPICGARASNVHPELGYKLPCRHRAGFGTEHYGEGRCKFHGGGSVPKHGRYSVLRHYDLAERVTMFFENPELMDIRTAVATSYAALDSMLEEDALITPERAQEIISAMARIGTMVKQHHDITEGQKIMIEVPQFMEWSEHLYELAIKYLLAANGDVRGFLAEAQQYYSSAIAIVTGDSPPAIGDGSTNEVEVVLRPGVPVS
jgi:hypothetical protein